MNLTVIPFGPELVARSRQEKIDQEVYQTIPALNSLANASLALSTKLTLDARNALFYSNRSLDPSLRRVAVELGVERRLSMEGAMPDLDYLAGQAKATRHQYESADNDIWLAPDEPNA
ncbi:hypothetical protein [Burkholderia sp. Tr-20390]|uniref:hypothetical protein n=1 Tax=Burkholderia sp. Tr-20390 TaxID=2703904 RepID=UPI00197E717E|nr:hypothetical protein [Burkholderia sp. Tr-20390]MBN3729529.1 hypothetical protein [Burkholderia sp. Tr-20390]